MLFAWITDPNAPGFGLGTLTLLEIVLWIDNIIFLSLVVASFLQHNVLMRAVWVGGEPWLCVWRCWHQSPWVTRLTNPLLQYSVREISARDLILLLGGLFPYLESQQGNPRIH